MLMFLRRLTITALLLAWSLPALGQSVWMTGRADAQKAQEPGEPEAKYYWEIDGFDEMFVDDDNSLYVERPYQGIIPRVRDTLEVLRAPQGAANTIMWVGYQHRRLFSRIFVQTTHMPVFTVLQKNAKHIVILFDRAEFRDDNSRREIMTGNFNTRVARIVPKDMGKGRAEIHIFLKESGSFLYRQEGNYLYLDVERSPTS
jgi:hypothetical protein